MSRGKKLIMVVSAVVFLAAVGAWLVLPYAAVKMYVRSISGPDVRSQDTENRWERLVLMMGRWASPYLQDEIERTDQTEWQMDVIEPGQLRSYLYDLLGETGGPGALEFAHRDVVEKCPTRADVDYLTPFDSPLTPWDVYCFLQVRGNEESVLLLLDCIQQDYAYPQDVPMNEKRRRYRLGQAVYALALYGGDQRTPLRGMPMYLTDNPEFTFITLINLLESDAKPFGRLKNTPEIQNRANIALAKITGRDFGFATRANAGQKQQAISRWRAWLRIGRPRK